MCAFQVYVSDINLEEGRLALSLSPPREDTRPARRGGNDYQSSDGDDFRPREARRQKQGPKKSSEPRTEKVFYDGF